MDPAFIPSLVYGHLFSKGMDFAMAVSERHINKKEFSDILNRFDQRFIKDNDAEITLCGCDMQSVIGERSHLIPLAENNINQDNADISRNLKKDFIKTAGGEIFGHTDWEKEKSSEVVEKYLGYFYDLVFMKEISSIPAGYRALLNAYTDNQHDINLDLYQRILDLEKAIRESLKNETARKKRFTNKKLVVPFTKEASNGAQGGTYVQRDDLLGKIAGCFETQTGKKRMAFLTGMGGCGKSELARAYAEVHSNEYEEIFWLTCSDGVTPELMPLFEDADTLCEVGKEDADEFSDKVLIIVDNCNGDDSKFLFALEHSTGDADILVTTRLSRIGDYEDKMILVESDDREEFAYQVFEKNFCKKPRRGNPKKIENDDVKAVHEICREVQYNTMMVSMIGIRLREYDDLSISDCAKKIREGVGTLDGRIRYSKDLEPRSEKIRDILRFLFSDILNHSFSDAEKSVLTVLSLTPASWYEIDYIVSLCRGTLQGTEYEDAVLDLLDLGWVQGDGERVAIHPLIAEVLTDKQVVARNPEFFEELVGYYLGMPDQYLDRERFLVNKILKMGETVQPESRLAVMLLINHGGYKKLFAEIFPEVKAAYFAYVIHDGRRRFLYRDLEKEETGQLTDVPCQVKEGKRAELLKVINTGVPYKLDLSVAFCGKEIEIVPNRLCRRDCYLRELLLSGKTLDIGNRAFSGCSGLSGELRLPQGLTSIGDSAFESCKGLSGELRLPEGLTSIGNSAFRGCKGLNGKLHLPKSLKRVGNSAFSGCKGLNDKLRLPQGLKGIGDSAFFNCSSLSGDLRLPEGLTSIGNSAFRGCKGLNGKLHLPKSLKRVGNSAFSGCKGLNGELHLPKGLTSIGARAFESCRGLSGKPWLPEGLTSIEDRAFIGCSGLNGKLHLPKDLTSIGDWAFSECGGIRGELCLPKGLKSIGDFAFWDCIGLSGKLRLPKGLKSIGASAFEDCIGLSGELRLPKGLTSIGASAFRGCKGLSGELRLPESLTSIGDRALFECDGIERIVFYNPSTEIKRLLNPYSSTIICGYRNSTAEEYARTQGLVFEELEA